MNARMQAPGVVLDVQGVSLSFGGLKAVQDISFQVHEREVLALIGPNGAGKTSVFNLISRFYPPSSGRIDLHLPSGTVRVTDHPAHAIAGLGIARTFQNIELFEHSTVLQNLLIGRHVHKGTSFWDECLFLPSTRRAEAATREKVEHVIDFLDLHSFRDLHVGALPYGVRKTVELARALCIEPRLLLLDEPSSGLNPEETEDIAFKIHDIVRQTGTAVLMVEHDMALVSRVAHRALAMGQGRMMALGTVDQVLAHPEVIDAYLGRDDDLSTLHRHASTGARA